MKACGEQGIREMVAAFYRRVRLDPWLGPMYPPDDWQGAESRLAEFLLFRIGGQTAYIEKRGHPRLRMRHMPFRIGKIERDRWLFLMREAMVEVNIPLAAQDALDGFFTQVAEMMRNQPD